MSVLPVPVNDGDEGEENDGKGDDEEEAIRHTRTQSHAVGRHTRTSQRLDQNETNDGEPRHAEEKEGVLLRRPVEETFGDLRPNALEYAEHGPQNTEEEHDGQRGGPVHRSFAGHLARCSARQHLGLLGDVGEAHEEHDNVDEGEQRGEVAGGLVAVYADAIDTPRGREREEEAETRAENHAEVLCSRHLGHDDVTVFEGGGLRCVRSKRGGVAGAKANDHARNEQNIPLLGV
mmetsp:Transcript_37879/g.82097  ORF Transcript_37879/g.82097 Transcript_37879/m.82097 type:complete len:233 (-) Transcript_37879:76-774(-)